VFRGCSEEAKITRILADSAKYDFEPWRRSIDFVFVDGSHEYEAVKLDTATAFEIVAPGGVIVWVTSPWVGMVS